MKQLNVFKKELELCCDNPLTGAYRDGYCNTGINDIGTHTVCAIVTDKFLVFSKSRGNDLTSDNPLYNFKGLKEGDKWCLCVSSMGVCSHHDDRSRSRLLYLHSTI